MGASDPGGLSEDEFFTVAKAWKEVEPSEPEMTRSRNKVVFAALAKGGQGNGVTKEHFCEFYAKALAPKLMPTGEKKAGLSDAEFDLGLAWALFGIDLTRNREPDRLLGDTGELRGERREFLVAELVRIRNL